MCRTLKRINTRKAPGPDGIPRPSIPSSLPTGPNRSTEDAIALTFHTALSHMDQRDTYNGYKKSTHPCSNARNAWKIIHGPSKSYVKMDEAVPEPGHLIVAGDQADNCLDISKFVDGVGAVEQSCVNREYSRGLSTQPWGAPVFRVRVEDVVLPIRTAWGLPVRKVQDLVTEGAVEPEVSELGDELGGWERVVWRVRKHLRNTFSPKIALLDGINWASSTTVRNLWGFI
ncbi:hypothetical protein L3Q82_009178 [Scortum barcoo]|uniref:Uncharacterized protein n=1 Tax=Scortum barcoo TaxID=214431 RepID=A0ACB8XAB3_9TELE|nr:hypothetical protein L3Q82_009178 [Scortum barcoo]